MMLWELMFLLQVLCQASLASKRGCAQMTFPALVGTMLCELMFGPCFPIWERDKHASTAVKRTYIWLEVCKHVDSNIISMLVIRFASQLTSNQCDS